MLESLRELEGARTERLLLQRRRMRSGDGGGSVDNVSSPIEEVDGFASVALELSNTFTVWLSGAAKVTPDAPEHVDGVQSLQGCMVW